MVDATAAESRRRRLVGTVAAIGGGSVITGALLPWLTVFSGFQSYAGISGANGRVLAAGGATALIVGVWYGVRGRTSLRYAIGVLGFVLAVFSAYLVAQLLAVYRALEGFFLPALGPGVFVAAAGALLMVATLLIGEASQPGDLGSATLDNRAATPIALAAAAGFLHLAVAAEAFIQHAPFGALFISVGVAQLGWAALVAVCGLSRWLLIAATANTIVVVTWIVSRTLGVPIGPQAGVPEPVGSVDSLTTACELALVSWVAWSFARRRAPQRRALPGQRRPREIRQTRGEMSYGPTKVVSTREQGLVVVNTGKTSGNGGAD
jgi:hypothetical protein